MKMKAIATYASLALAALVMPLTSLGGAAADIIEIFPVLNGGKTAEDSLGAYEKFQFTTRMLSRNWDDSMPGATEPGDQAMSWDWAYLGSGSASLAELNTPPRLGIVVSGQLRYADYISVTPYEGNSAAFTDITWEYTVKPGDLALPVKLAMEGSTEAKPIPARLGMPGSFYVLNSGIWGLKNASNDVAVFTICSDSTAASAIGTWTRPEGGTLIQDWTLENAGFYVKTMDFDGVTADGDIWRDVYQGIVQSYPSAPRVESVDGNSVTEAVKLYAWCADESAVTVDSSVKYTGPDGVERAVYEFTVSGEETYEIPLKGVSQTGGAGGDGITELILSANPTNTIVPYTASDIEQNFLSRKVRCIAAPDPYMSVTGVGGNPEVSITATTNYAAATEMKLSFSKEFTKDVEVKLEFEGNAGTTDFADKRYFTVLREANANPVTQTSVDSVIMPAGKTEVVFYVYAFGASAETAAGITVTPSVSDADAQAFFAAGIDRQVNATMKITDQLPAVEVVAPPSAFAQTEIEIDVTVDDNWRDLQKDLNTEGYSVTIQLGSQNVLVTNNVNFAAGTAITFPVTVPAEGHPLAGKVLVSDATHGSRSTVAEFEIDANAALTAGATFYTDSTATNAYASGYFFKEGDTPSFRIELTSPATSKMYAFLVPLDYNASNLVQCVNVSNGLEIASGAVSSEVGALKFLDGFTSLNPMRARFSVALKSTETIDDPNAVDYTSTYTPRSISLSAVNVSPGFVNGTMQLNDMTVENGGTMPGNVPVGTEAKFSVRVADASSVDLAATGNEAIVTKWQFTGPGGMVYNRYVTNSNARVTCPFVFSDENSTYDVKVWARDKDDLAEFGDVEWGEVKYNFFVNVAQMPTVRFTTEQYGDAVTAMSFVENGTKSTTFFYVELSELPTGAAEGSLPISGTNPLVVQLTTEMWGSDGYLTFETTNINFNANTRSIKVFPDLTSLNGGADTLFNVTAKVITDSCSNYYGQAWSDYYAAASCEMSVINVEPAIVTAKRTNGTFSETTTNNCSVGEIVKIDWKVADVLPDITNGVFNVSWSIEPSASSPTANPQVITNGWKYVTQGRKTNVEGSYEFIIPDISGEQTITMTVDDGDGGTAEKSWVIYVAPTKRIKVNVFGPAATAQSKYNSAKGIGQGFVAAKGTSITPLCEQFVQTWYYSEKSSIAELCAWGYPSKATAESSGFASTFDDGQIPAVLGSTAIGIALNQYGSKWVTGSYYDWSTMGGLDETAGDYDNFFYTWMIIKSASSSEYQEGGKDENIVPSPTYQSLASTTRTFNLDGGSDKQAGVYGMVEVEAVFSREWRKMDNLGDINADGIPDIFVSMLGIGSGEVGTVPENDLAPQHGYNEDEDYLPNTDVSVYSSLIPGLPSDWVAADRPFTAKMEIRGYHDGLNNAAKLLGVSRARLEDDYNSDDVEKRKAARDYSEVEMAAWAETGYAKEWSPERPTDPCTADYDEDKLPDGYEYYFWYKAYVGYMENGVHKYLKGRRFNPRKPIEGDEISRTQIAALMDPRTPADVSMIATQDSDNDGLPDLLEFELGTNPFDFDTDGDGLPDGYEIMMSGTDPLLYATDKVTPDGRRNLDGDAMAFTCYEHEKLILESELIPTDATIRKYVSFMVETAAGEIEWRVCKVDAIAANPITYTDSGVAVITFEYLKGSEWVKAAVLGATAPATVDDAGEVLATDLDKASTFEVVDGPDSEIVRQLPVALSAGTPVQNIAATPVNYADAFLSADISDADCNAGWLYRKEGVDYIALAAPAAAKMTEPVRVLPDLDIEVLKRRQVAHLHYLVYQDFGFDPRTAWNWKTPLAPRWGRIDSSTGESIGDVMLLSYGYANRATRTREYTTMDEFLLMSFYLWNGVIGDADVKPSANVRTWLNIFVDYTTNPRGPGDGELLGETGETEVSDFNLNGADTDEDGVPDGWELYVMSGPKQLDGTYTLVGPKVAMSPTVGDAVKATDTDVPMDWDELSQLQEFAGTDSCAHYSVAGDEEGAVAFSTTIVRPAEHAKWLNKFFPTDPWNKDTDEDAMDDNKEFGKFIYGDPADDGKLTSIPGGGLNPLSIDTDLDGLPDAWEAQYAGKTLYAGEDGDKAKDADGNPIGNNLQGLIDGMDGTVSDAYTAAPMVREADGSIIWWVSTVTGRKYIINRDYDNDGLENWQEYLTCTMRAWRYDDPITGFSTIPREFYWTLNADTGTWEWDPKLDKLGVADMNEFWYQTLVNRSVDNPLYNPMLVTGMNPSSQYFVPVTKRWDIAFRNHGVNAQIPVAYYHLYDRTASGEKMYKVWGYADFMNRPRKYAGCSPINADTDQDGMDDYYELFHGMNPLLGKSGVLVESEGPCDIVYDAWYNEAVSGAPCTALENKWKKADDKFDFVKFPWLNGLADADPDGDDIRNQEEALMPRFATATWHHTDPTPLWMTDSSYSNSLVNLHFRLPTRAAAIPLDSEEFEYDGVKYSFRDFHNFCERREGLSIVKELSPFVPDFWSLSTADAPNWMFSFEENEGFDTDHDGISDNEELQGRFGSGSDPQKSDSPNRRQAMYFPGDKSALQTLPFLDVKHPIGGEGYPEDLAFLQYTVECWVCPESNADATVLERAIWASESNYGDQEFLRCNFQLAIKGGKWYTKFDPRGTLADTQVEVFSEMNVNVGEWTHLAAAYDGRQLVLYVNGVAEVPTGSSLQPEYGVNAVAVDSANVFSFAVDYTLNAVIVGASAKTQNDGANGSALNLFNCVGWDGYKDYFKGYIDEIRIWDGARTATDIAADRNVRYTDEMIKANREKFCSQWMKGERRYKKDASGNDYEVVPELRFHYSFDSVPGAQNADQVATVPHGFNNNWKTDSVNTGSATRPEDYTVGWWSKVLAAYGSVYSAADWVTWVHNTVTHLPRYDGTTFDSVYWSADFQGAAGGTYKFHLVSEPVSYWTQMIRNKVSKPSGYRSNSTRHFMVNKNGIGSFHDLFEFTGRYLNQYGDDMLPLGGAYVKYIDEMWDNQGASTAWEITGNDADNDGLPDWWEMYIEVAGVVGEVDWDTVIEWPVGSGITLPAGDAYLRDIASGVHADKFGEAVTDDDAFAQKSDENRNGLPDWWEKLYGIYGVDALADSDNDGLPNYVEYLLSEVFMFKGIRFNPIKACSVDQYIPDYFFKVGELYAGEIFTDHDLVEDSWEDKYANTYASRLAYDALADSDEDGWSNRSEARYSMQSMPIVADQQTHYSSVDGLVADYPIPTLAMTIRYTGSRRSEVSIAPLVITTTTDETLQAEPDATFTIGELKGENAGTGSDSSDGSAEELKNQAILTRTLGKWSDRVAVGTLTPGNITANALALQCCYDPSSLRYTWQIFHEDFIDIHGRWEQWYETKSGTRAEYDADLLKWGNETVTLLSSTSEYMDLVDLELRTNEDGSTVTWTHTKTGKVLGTVDITTGEYSLNLGIFKGQLVQEGTNTESLTSLEDQSFRIKYAVNPSVGLPRRLYLGQATSGYVREGKNTVTVFADINGDGKWQTSEPFGTVRDVDISWRRREVDVELTDTHPVFARVVLSDKYGNGEASGATDREHFYGTESGNHTNLVVGTLSGGTRERVRVVRTLVDGLDFANAPHVGAKVVMDKMINLEKRGFLHEGDFMTDEELDIDWKSLASDINGNFSGLNYNKITYRIVLGNGDTSILTDNNLLGVAINRMFDTEQVVPVPVVTDEIVYESSPTFVWTTGGRDTYTAFRIAVFSVNGVPIWDSGIRRTPAVDSDGNYRWKAPLFVGDVNELGRVFENKAYYTWKVSMYNSKFKTDKWSETVAKFYMNVQTDGFQYGTANVAVKYFGPAKAYQNKRVRVRAYTSPDFTGTPVAAGYVANPDDADSGIAVAGKEPLANAKLIGIPAGTYYLQAFIDSDGDGECDEWESSGYLCARDGSRSDLNPSALNFGRDVGPGETVAIYIEDADTDRDGLPDAWEWGVYARLDLKGVEMLNLNTAGEFAISSQLTGSLLDEWNEDMVPSAGLAGVAYNSLANAGTLALALGANVDSATASFAGAISGTVSDDLAEDGVSITSLEFTDGKIVVKVDAEVVSGSGSTSVLASAVTGESDGLMTVGCYVSYTPSLAQNWSEWTKVGDITVGAGEVEVDASAVIPADLDNCFIKIKLAK